MESYDSSNNATTQSLILLSKKSILSSGYYLMKTQNLIILNYLITKMAKNWTSQVKKAEAIERYRMKHPFKMLPFTVKRYKSLKSKKYSSLKGASKKQVLIKN